MRTAEQLSTKAALSANTRNSEKLIASSPLSSSTTMTLTKELTTPVSTHVTRRQLRILESLIDSEIHVERLDESEENKSQASKLSKKVKLTKRTIQRRDSQKKKLDN